MYILYSFNGDMYIYVKQQYDSRLMGLFIPICLMDYFEGYPT